MPQSDMSKPTGKSLKPGLGYTADIAADAGIDSARNKSITLGAALAAEGIARKFATNHKSGSVFRRVSRRLPGLNTAIEMGLAGKEMNDRQKPGGFNRHANEGDAMRRAPALYQAAKTVVSPASTLARIGASKEREDKVAFEKKQTAFTSSGVGRANDSRNKMIEQRSKDTQEILSRPKQSKFRTQLGSR
jgi:hypothetical protein